jgi:HTH-type transcriptional regulator/antitoxin HigA
MNPTIIHTDEQLYSAIDRAHEIFDAPDGSPEAVELNILLSAIEDYERRTVKLPKASLIARIRFRLDQRGWLPKWL